MRAQSMDASFWTRLDPTNALVVRVIDDLRAPQASGEVPRELSAQEMEEIKAFGQAE